MCGGGGGGGFKGFPHTITYSIMHFKQLRDDLVEKNGKNRCGDLLKNYQLQFKGPQQKPPCAQGMWQCCRSHISLKQWASGII